FFVLHRRHVLGHLGHHVGHLLILIGHLAHHPHHAHHPAHHASADHSWLRLGLIGLSIRVMLFVLGYGSNRKYRQDCSQHPHLQHFVSHGIPPPTRSISRKLIADDVTWSTARHDRRHPSK